MPKTHGFLVTAIEVCDRLLNYHANSHLQTPTYKLPLTNSHLQTPTNVSSCLGSTRITNEHALKIFLRRVSKQNIAYNKRVTVQIHSWLNLYNSLDDETFEGAPASSLLAISRALANHFKGLQFLRLEMICRAVRYV